MVTRHGARTRLTGPALLAFALMVTSLVLLAGLSTPDAARGAAGDLLWSVPFRTGADDTAVAVPAGPSGSAFLCGTITSAGTPQVVVLDESVARVPVWAFGWGGTLAGGAELETVVYDPGAARLYLVATIADPVHGSGLTVLRVGSDGKLVWSRSHTFLSLREPAAEAAAVDGHGAVYVTGTSRIPGVQDSHEAFVVKFSARGAIVWERTWASGSSSAEVSGMTVTSAGRCYVVGHTVGDDGAYDGFVRAFTSQGRTQWSKRFAGTARYTVCRAVAVGPDGSIVVAGMRQAGPATVDAVAEKYGAGGRRAWRRAVPCGPAELGFFSVAFDTRGRPYAGGGIAFADRAGAILVALRSSGAVRWTSQWDRPRGGIVSGLAVAGSRIYAACSFDAPAAGATDVVGAECLDTSGRLIWQRAYEVGGAPRYGAVTGLSVVRGESVYVSARIGDAATGNDGLFLRLAP